MAKHSDEDHFSTHLNVMRIRWRNQKFEDTNLEQTDVVSANIRMCHFNKISARQANFSEIVFENNKAQGGDFRFADFANASLIESDFSRSCFEGANLEKANFEACNLRGVDFRTATVKNTSFRDADLRGADFTGAIIENADFTGADMRGTIFDAAVEEALFESANNHNNKKNNNHNINNNQPPVELVNAVAPIVTKILKQAQSKGVVNGDHWERELQQTLEQMGVTTSTPKLAEGWDEQIDFWLNRLGNLDVAELLDSLDSTNENTPKTVANMLEGLVGDLGLQQGARTEDLIEALTAKLKKA